jgi:hypothetical protein
MSDFRSRAQSLGAERTGRLVVGARFDRRDCLVAPAILLATLCVYLCTFSAVPTSDGLTEAIRIQSGDPEGLYRAVKLLYQPMGFVLYRATQHVGLSISPIRLLQIMNALVGSSVVAGFFLLLRFLTGNRLASVLGAAVLAFSHSFWFYLNGEVHVFSVASLLAAAWVLLGRDLRRVGTWLLVGILHGLAILFHLDNVGFGVAVLALVLSPVMARCRVRAVVAYSGTMLTIIAVPYFLAGRALNPEVSPWLHWYDVLLREVVGDHQFTQATSVFSSAYSLVQLAKGQATALTIGGDVVADLARNSAEYAYDAHLVALLALTAVIAVVSLVVFARAWRHRKNSWCSFRTLTVFLLSWLMGLEVIRFFWTPSTDEYYVTTLLPLIVVLLLGLLSQDQHGRWYMTGSSNILVGALAVLVFTTDLVGAVLPWKQFGENVLLTARRVQEISQEDALFITPDSSIPLEYFTGREVSVWKPELYVGLEAGLETLGTAINAALSERRQVFLFRWHRPSEFFFDEYNLRNHTNLSYSDFSSAFRDWATDRYVLTPVVHYWEWQFRYDTYGNQEAIMYRVELVDGGAKTATEMVFAANLAQNRSP